MSLNEKAKTTKEIAELWNQYCKEGFTEVPQQIMEQMEAIWVRLEDAQKEIDELKQKLLGLLNEYPSNDGIDVPYDDEIRVTRLIQWKQKLERFINGL